MMKWAAIAGLSGCALFAGLYAFQSNKLVKTKLALEAATDYIDQSKDIDDALTDLPTEPDAVLKRLCAINPRGAGCGNP